MAIYLQGKTACPICDKIVEMDQQRIGYPILFLGEKNKLKKYNDSIIHVSCLNNSSIGNELSKHYNKYKLLLDKGPYLCRLCGKQIIECDKLFGLGYHIANEKTLLNEYNCAVFHKDCLKNWSKLRFLVDELIVKANADCWPEITYKTTIKVLERLL